MNKKPAVFANFEGRINYYIGLLRVIQWLS